MRLLLLRAHRLNIDILVVAPFHEPCAAEMTAMLGCWAATKDSMSVGPCAAAAQGLFACMRTVVRNLTYQSRRVDSQYIVARKDTATPASN